MCCCIEYISHKFTATQSWLMSNDLRKPDCCTIVNSK